MNTRLIALITLLATGPLAADDKGFCPPLPLNQSTSITKTPAPRTPPVPDAQFVGTVTLMAVISNKGYVCEAHVVHGLDNATDGKATDSLRQGHFRPAYKGGHAVPVVVSVDVNYWRKDSQLIQVPPSFTQTQGSSEHAQ